MKLSLILILLCLVSCSPAKKSPLDIAFTSKLTKEEVHALLEEKLQGKLKRIDLAERLGSKNLTYFLLTTHAKDLYNPKFEIDHFPLSTSEKATNLAIMMKTEGAFVSFKNVKKSITYEDISELKKLGTVVITNNLFKAKILFIENKKTGEILKMAIAHKNSKSPDDGLKIF